MQIRDNISSLAASFYESILNISWIIWQTFAGNMIINMCTFGIHLLSILKSFNNSNINTFFHWLSKIILLTLNTLI